jgi:hypothetical protein
MLLPEDWVCALQFIDDLPCYFWLFGKDGSVLCYLQEIYVLFENCLFLSLIESEALSVHLNGEINHQGNDKRAYKKDNSIHVLIEKLQY